MSNYQSFSDDTIPRHAPQPSVTIKQQQQIAAPTVPEVSLIFDKNEEYYTVSNTGRVSSGDPSTVSNASRTLPLRTYSSWKREEDRVSKNPTVEISSNDLIKKQVRFEPLSKPIMSSKEADKINRYTFPPVPKPTNSTESCHSYSRNDSYDNSTTLSQPRAATLDEIFLLEQIVKKFIPNENKLQDNLQTVTNSNSCGSHEEIRKIYDIIRQQNEQIQQIQQQVTKIFDKIDTAVVNKEIPKTIRLADKSVQCSFDDNLLKAVSKVTVETMTSFDIEDPQTRAISSVPSKTSDKENTGMTFYGNVLGQVNNILEKKTPNVESNCIDCTAKNHQISETPVMQRRSYDSNIAITSAPHPSTPKNAPTVTNTSPQTTERSMAMNALALKYLSNDKLSELILPINQPTIQLAPRHPLGILCMQETVTKPKPQNEMSFATFQYMEKYGLSNCGSGDNPAHRQNLMMMMATASNFQNHYQQNSPIGREEEHRTQQQEKNRHQTVQGHSSPCYEIGRNSFVNSDSHRS